jgi:hypothetical protein
MFLNSFLTVRMIVTFIRKEIYYNDKVEGNGEKREKHFLLPMQEMGVETP